MVYTKILVPVDGSPTAALGLAEALRLARDQKAKLRLVHVVDELFVMTSLEAGAYTASAIEAMRENGRVLLEQAAAEVAKQGYAAESALRETFSGRAADEIVAEARECRADLIVLGTHGRRGVSRLVMGSDAEQVVRDAPVPVLLVRAQEPAGKSQGK
jgi:nucleotide-binding universal stress UspA family protein